MNTPKRPPEGGQIVKPALSALGAVVAAVVVGAVLLLSRPASPKPAALIGDVPSATATLAPSPTVAPTPTATETPTMSPAPTPTMHQTGPQESPPPLASWTGPANLTPDGTSLTTGGSPHTPVFDVSGAAVQLCWTIGESAWSGVELNSWPIPSTGLPAFRQEVSVGQASGCATIDVDPGKYVVIVTSTKPWKVSVTPA